MYERGYIELDFGLNLRKDCTMGKFDDHGFSCLRNMDESPLGCIIGSYSTMDHYDHT